MVAFHRRSLNNLSLKESSASQYYSIQYRIQQYMYILYEWDTPLEWLAIVSFHFRFCYLLMMFVLLAKRTKPVFFLRQMLHFFFEILLSSINDVIVLRLQNDDYLLEFTISIFFSLFIFKSIMLRSKNHLISFSFWGLLHYYCT